MEPDGPSYVYAAELVRVIDGDTIEARIDQGFGNWTVQRLRLSGYNAPEVRGPQRPEGLQDRAALAGLLVGRPLLVRTIKLRGRDVRTFERYAADAWAAIPGGGYRAVAQAMIDLGFDVPREESP